MKKLRKLLVFALSLATLLSGIALDGVETQAAGTTHKINVSLSGTNTLRVKSGKKNVKEKTVSVEKGDKISFSYTKNKNIKSVTYKSTNKKCVTVTKKGKATAKKAGTAKIKITVKRKKGKALSTWVKLKIKDNAPNSSSDTQTDVPSGNEKSIVLYFSRAGENYNVGVVEKGSTQIVAEMIAQKTGADIFKLETVNPYPADYMECVTVTQEEKTANARPELKALPEDLAEYKNIYLGYPIWHADMPMALYTFLENNDLTGKTILPFCTHAGSGLAGTVETIRAKCPGAAVTEGLAIAGTTVQENTGNTEIRLDAWLEKVRPQEDTSKFDLEKGTVMLNNGIEMPILGIGTYTLSDSQAENSVYWVLRDGYRLIDTARIYGNETGVGRGIRRAIDEGICTREEIFVTTKMWTSDYDNGAAAIDASLGRLGLDYIDLMILHHSQPSNDVQAYQAMEQAVRDGKLKSIGLSNYYTAEDFDRLVNATSIIPALLQNETHPYHQSTAMKEHLKQYGTVMESWFPLGGRGNTQRLFEDETISGIAKAHGKTSAQVILRWHLQAGNIAIPGSSNEAHIQENCEIFDFSLSDEEMKRMTALDKNERFADY